MFKKILIANRGEIAVRIIKACQEMDITAVAVYSDADRSSLHIQTADEAVYVGAAPAVESYLNIDRIIQAARDTGSEAIHPGYGFLAENAEFAQRCEKENIVFIGPNSKAMKLVGDKIRSRQVMEKAGIPIIPGMKGALQDPSKYKSEAEKIGYPVMIKASAGGGGKGMRIVYKEADLKPALEAGKREAKAAFGNDSVYLEKYIEEPRHIEFQVLADNFGNTVHIFERECSIQRRHQKIVEESPSTALETELREKMGAIARKVINVTGYNNAGTVEFLLDKDKKFYFLEVNARLQVEHPVTELISGIDLVLQQIEIAAGQKLAFKQKELQQKGHAIECRIYAEDPQNNFLPSSGKILFLKEPAGPGVRHDSGIYSDCDVPVYYDPILAKLIVWAADRDKACTRMAKALGNYVVLGIKTNIGFLKDLISHPRFKEGKTTTDFIKVNFPDWHPLDKPQSLKELALAVAAFTSQDTKKQRRGYGAEPKETFSPWNKLGKWSIGGGK
jgi:acetyl-CoA carboxylase biotin carboxylase subunit